MESQTLGNIICNLFPGEYLLYLYTGEGGGGGGVRMKGQIQTQEYGGFSVNFAPKNIVMLHIFFPKIWFYYSHKFDNKELFLRYYITELRENGTC